ncbi:SDR family mycofactocin-dependent oxidoreductase [Herbihabitans rhizosphaerae]|uniref:SDR family mycofactocin-dependent oxidoreductase n=1 Tax=Herbihabitans rhizosphaerae TaxID=1872711 RepID=A0A4Q7KWF0_9PSEU|nr:mycofactocin-coupled SDR family oxidoreductase [Herbihabitans rhizosphaerae]RZS40987.1 SDR family mycofactocin-dependent oxidoreductase [Herbihabitans rhizosphaerae]
MGKLDGKVALITGGARGQGRSHAVTLAREGADIVACDLVADLDTVPYSLATQEDLDETVRLVEAHGRHCLGVRADVRELADMESVVAQAIDKFERVDIALANAGVSSSSAIADMSEPQWREVIEVNLTGVFTTFRAVVPHMIANSFGRIVATSSIIARMGGTNSGHYTASKWGVIGLVKSLALEVMEHGITVNAVLPGGVDTDFIHNKAVYKVLRPDLEDPTREDVLPMFDSGPTPGLMDPSEVSEAILFLVTESGRHMTGEAISLSGGMSASNAT